MSNLRQTIATLIADGGALGVAVAFHDYETEETWSWRADRWFHAASTIKVAILLAVFDAVHRDELSLDDRVHVRNRFHSAANAEPYRVAPERDSGSGVQSYVGRSMKVRELAQHMITTSSNLATNLLWDLVRERGGREVLERHGIQGIKLRRGVEDQAAFEAGLNNQVTAHGLLALFRLLAEGKAVSVQSSRQMLEILGEQEFRSGIPAGLPDSVRTETRFAHKTGEISTMAHDAGLVTLPGRERPYALVVLTEWSPDSMGRQGTVSTVSRAIYDHVTGTSDG